MARKKEAYRSDMEMLLLNTVEGLKPCFDADYDNKKKLKIGQTYKAKIVLARNLDFHRKYFSLINTAWAYQSEAREEFFFHDINCFRKTVEIAAGNCEKVYSLVRGEWVDIPKSISFDKMDELEFRDLYERVKDVLFKTFLTHISEEEFMSNLINY